MSNQSNQYKLTSAPVIFRPVSMFAPDREAGREGLTEEIRGRKVCVMGEAGSNGTSFIEAVLRLEPKSVRGGGPQRERAGGVGARRPRHGRPLRAGLNSKEHKTLSPRRPMIREVSPRTWATGTKRQSLR